MTAPKITRPQPDNHPMAVARSNQHALLILLGVLGLLIWLLLLELGQPRHEQQQLAHAASENFAKSLELGLSTLAQSSLTVLNTAPTDLSMGAKHPSLHDLRKLLPSLSSIAMLDMAGELLGDSDPQAIDHQHLGELLRDNKNKDYHFAFAAAARPVIYLLLQANEKQHYWVLRLSPEALQPWLQDQQTAPFAWKLQHRANNLVIAESQGIASSAAQARPYSLENTVSQQKITNSDWILSTMAANSQTPKPNSKLSSITLCLFLTLIAMFRLIREPKQQQTSSTDATQQYYRDIFHNAGTALCILDLVDFYHQLRQPGIDSSEKLRDWLAKAPSETNELARSIVFTETNQAALLLLGVEKTEQAQHLLCTSTDEASREFVLQLALALFDGDKQFEQERLIQTRDGKETYLWLILRLPKPPELLHSVILSIRDISHRKRIQLSLEERERFWAAVVRTVPDTLYIVDIPSRKLLFSNHRQGSKLGYSPDFVKKQGEKFWSSILHPDDADYYQRLLSLQTVLGPERVLESQLRMRQQDGHWRDISLREQALSHNASGHVARLVGLAKDVTELIQRNQSLRDSEQRYRLLAESSSDVILSTNNRLDLNYISPSIQSVLGYSSAWVQANGLGALANDPQQLIGIYQLLRRTRDALNGSQQIDSLRQQLKQQMFVFDCLHADGRKIPVELRLTALWDETGSFRGLLGVGRDISQQRRAEKDLRMAATVFEHSTSAILVTDPAGYIAQVNNAFSRISGYSSYQVLDQSPCMLAADPQQSNLLSYELSQLGLRGNWEGEVWLKRQTGEVFPAWVGITAVYDDEDDLVSYVYFFSDISERKASEQRIHRLAYYDALTQLPNRTLFQDRLHTALQYAERNQEWVALMFLDLDRFKPINDSLGHAAGDRMLKDVAARLLCCVGIDDTVARMGGDEFTLLLKSRNTRDGALHRTIQVAKQILASLADAFVLENREFFVSASIGIALYPQDGAEPSQLMKNADTAMYHAKERGKNNFQFYQMKMNASALERLELESDLRHALDQGQFLLHYQAQFASNGTHLTGVEALLRWQHPRRGLVSPDAFIPVLEELGLVVQVGEWVITEATRQLSLWHAAKIHIPKVSVNLSARQFNEGNLHKRIEKILKNSGIAPACLELELTESILMQDVPSSMRALHDLKRLGLCLAIDDFGIGYSSLNYLKQFPIDVLKIDRSFVDGLPEGIEDGQIARAIIAMAHSLNLRVIAEGVENRAQLDFLLEHGCDEVQGFLLGKPLPAQQFQAEFMDKSHFSLE